MGFCSSSINFLLFVSNLIFAFIGIILIAVGVYVVTDLKSYTDFLASSDDIKVLGSGGYILIGIGAFITIVYGLGIVGACIKNSCMLYSFAISLILLIIVELAIGISLFLFAGEAKDTVSTLMKDTLNGYNNDDIKSVKIGWDEIQKNFECCGVNNYTDWKDAFNNKTQKVVRNVKNNRANKPPKEELFPKTCCDSSQKGHYSSCYRKDKFEEYGEESVYSEGCFAKFEGFVGDKVTLIGGFTIGIAVMQLFSIFAAWYFAKHNQLNYKMKENEEVDRI